MSKYIVDPDDLTELVPRWIVVDDTGCVFSPLFMSPEDAKHRIEKYRDMSTQLDYSVLKVWVESSLNSKGDS